MTAVINPNNDVKVKLKQLQENILTKGICHKTVLERIVNFGTNRILNPYSIVRIGRTEYRVITRSKKTIQVVFLERVTIRIEY